MQQSPTQADPAQSAEPLPPYAQLLQARFDELPGREQEILLRRALADTPETLDVIGASMGVTRERIRQLETHAVNRLTGARVQKVGRPRVATLIAEPATA